MVVLLVAYGPVLACDANEPCDKCAKQPELSWNPDDRLATDQLKRFYSLKQLIEAAYKANDMVAATNLAKEYLELARTYRCNWNYGNAIHDANNFLGLISLRNGETEAAVDYLLKAGKSTGSPQLNTFGPDLALANELLKQGQVAAVKTYLTDIKTFWEMDSGQVANWLTRIENGDKPELDRFGAHRPSAAERILFWLAVAWPALVAAVCLYSLRRRISRKWLFAVTTVVCGYLAMVLASWGAAYLGPRILTGMSNAGESTVLFVVYAAVGVGFIFPALAIFFVSRLFITEKTS